MTPELQETLAPVLGAVPSGVFILVAGDGNGKTTGLLASWIQQASFDPPQLTVAVNKSRYLNAWLSEGAPVTLNQVAKDDGVLFKHFGKGFEPDQDAFDGVETEVGTAGLPVLTASLATMEGRVVSSLEAADHQIYLVEITNGVRHQESDASGAPFVHIRKNGFHY